MTTPTQTGYVPPEAAPPIDLRAPLPRVETSIARTALQSRPLSRAS